MRATDGKNLTHRRMTDEQIEAWTHGREERNMILNDQRYLMLSMYKRGEGVTVAILRIDPDQVMWIAPLRYSVQAAIIQWNAIKDEGYI